MFLKATDALICNMTFNSTIEIAHVNVNKEEPGSLLGQYLLTIFVYK